MSSIAEPVEDDDSTDEGTVVGNEAAAVVGGKAVVAEATRAVARGGEDSRTRFGKGVAMLEERVVEEEVDGENVGSG